MRQYVRLLILGTLSFFIYSCHSQTRVYGAGNIKIEIEQGAEWFHDFPLFMGIKVKNTPQMAIWLEDPEGNYLSTLYVTHRAATGRWRMAGGNRRKEALPHWSHQRGIQYEGGLYLPTRDEPLPDGISGATPKGSFELKVTPENGQTRFVIKVEVNHSTDFNEHFPKTAKEGDLNYSGGKQGSGQPALVYAVYIDTTSDQQIYEAELLGHSSPDGSDGAIYADLSGITTASCILHRIRVILPD